MGTYRDYIFDTVRNYPESFNASTRFRNIVKLHDKWKDE